MRKKLKLLLTFVFIVIQLLPFINVNALNGENDNNGKITITNPEIKQNYSVYQILILESYDTERNAYTYKVDPTSAWYEFLTKEAGKDYVKVETGTNIVTWKENANQKEFAEKALAYAKKNSINPTASKKAEAKPLEFSGLNLGYYLVDSSLGALCNLTTTNPIISIIEKNGIPTVDKEVMEDSTNKYGKSNNDQIGSTVYFKTTINVQSGAENYVLYDIMDQGLTLNEESIVVELYDGTQTKTLTVDTDYKVSFSETEYTFIIDFEKSLEDTLKNGDKLIVSYNAILNENAVVGGTGNKNETYLKYGDNNKSNHDETRTYTFSFNLIKTDGKNPLSGAEFDLYDASTGGNKINLVKTGDNTYRVATPAEINAEGGFESAKIVAGNIIISGLDDDSSYYLEETKAPNGYNKLTSRVEVRLETQIGTDNMSSTTVGGNNSPTVKYEQNIVNIINITGSLLPETGGIGTTLFIIIGMILVLGFGVLLVTKLRMSKMTF